MGISDAVQWWEEWQLRILVLCSLFLQCFLCFANILRKHCIPSWLRFFIWLAYLGSDAVAIYALATLFNHTRHQEWPSTHHRSSTSLQVLWAPILLVHLGGQDAITAYNIEDNELWRRHVLTAVSQVAIAVYVFSKSWLGERKILEAAILLFFVGIFKCVLKPWDLKRVSINSLVGSSSTDSEEKGKIISSLDEYLRAAKECFQVDSRGQSSDSTEVPLKLYNLCVDLAPSHSARLTSAKHFMRRSPDEAHGLLRCGLAATFDRLYTKKNLYFIEVSKPHRCFFTVAVCVLATALFLPIQLIVRNFSSNRIDFLITTVLMTFAFYMEITREVVAMPFNHKFKAPWPDQVAQYNLIGYLARNQRHRTLRKLATLLVCKDYLDQLWCMKPYKSSSNITELVHGYIKTGWQEINDIPSYRRFNDNRGQWTLEREGLLSTSTTLGWSLRRPFDESVFLWHLATDFCFHHMDTPSHQDARRSRVMSNYMVYLLFVNPEMLIPGARRNLFRDTYNTLKDIPLYEKPPLDEKVLAQNVIHRVMDRERSGAVHDSWAIAHELLMLNDDGKIWRVIQGVWVEMLCFSAGRCRGYLHAKSLGKGGEYLSYVWLLLLNMGMETLAEKMQRSEFQEDGDEGGSVVARPGPASPVAAPAAEEIKFDKRRGAFD